MTTKLSAEQRSILDWMENGYRLYRTSDLSGNHSTAYELKRGTLTIWPSGQSVNGLLARSLIVWGSDGYKLSPAGREAAK